MNPFVQQMMMTQAGLPPGRRANGFGASPLGPSGPVPVHQMNFLPMAQAHMFGGPAGAALGAGRYPYPRQSVPAAAMNMGIAMPMNGMGMNHSGMASPFGGYGGGMNMNVMDPFTMALIYGGGGGIGGGGCGGGAAMNSVPDFFDILADDPDDRGVWDIDDDDPDLMAAYLKKARKMPHRRRKACMGGGGGLPPGLGGGMSPFQMYPMGVGMGIV